MQVLLRGSSPLCTWLIRHFWVQSWHHVLHLFFVWLTSLDQTQDEKKHQGLCFTSQGKKFKDKLPATGQTDEGYPDSDSSSDSTTSSHVAPGEQFLRARWHQSERAGERFVSSIRGLFNSQHRRARSMLRTMREPKEEEEEDVEQLDKDNSSEDDDRRMVVPKKLRHRGRSSSKSRPTTISHKIHHSSHPKGSASYIFGNCFLL